MSILVVTYRRPQLLRRTIESLLAQTYGDFELLISDDASGDETLSVSHEYAARDKRIRVRTNPRNLGMPGNLNAAIKECSHELVVNCHDADFYAPSLIEKWTHLMEANPSVGFACCNWSATDETGNLPAGVEEAQPHLPPILNGHAFLRELFFHWSNVHFGSWVWGTVMGRKSVYERLGFFDPAYGFVADVDMWMRIALMHDVGIVRGVLIHLPPRTVVPHLFDDTVLQRKMRRLFWRNRIQLARSGGASLSQQMAMHAAHVAADGTWNAACRVNRMVRRRTTR